MGYQSLGPSLSLLVYEPGYTTITGIDDNLIGRSKLEIHDSGTMVCLFSTLTVLHLYSNNTLLTTHL